MYMTMKLLNQWHKSEGEDNDIATKVEQMIEKKSLAQQRQLLSITESYTCEKIKAPCYVGLADDLDAKDAENKRVVDAVKALECKQHQKEMYLLQLYMYANKEEACQEATNTP